MTNDMMTMDVQVDHFFISTYENQLIFIQIDDEEIEQLGISRG